MEMVADDRMKEEAARGRQRAKKGGRKAEEDASLSLCFLAGCKVSDSMLYIR